ncbi:unnamed protein product [Acanthoscelides obtectus]|uniref:Uncharacterized protein n=1 Tax=Acanthoscelides obtectus TaxID=200917 RepID=A0A9P0QGA1_ACAOB|nr:unnamed protein product [Acanthoscelides obtectus]CAK1683027.1 hypothetical protein AOBTE_LOCUS34043 [Acanthoscelides obtectus]
MPNPPSSSLIWSTSCRYILLASAIKKRKHKLNFNKHFIFYPKSTKSNDNGRSVWVGTVSSGVDRGCSYVARVCQGSSIGIGGICSRGSHNWSGVCSGENTWFRGSLRLRDSLGFRSGLGSWSGYSQGDDGEEYYLKY